MIGCEDDDLWYFPNGDLKVGDVRILTSRQSRRRARKLPFGFQLARANGDPPPKPKPRPKAKPKPAAKRKPTTRRR